MVTRLHVPCDATSSATGWVWPGLDAQHPSPCPKERGQPALPTPRATVLSPLPAWLAAWCSAHQQRAPRSRRSCLMPRLRHSCRMPRYMNVAVPICSPLPSQLQPRIPLLTCPLERRSRWLWAGAQWVAALRCSVGRGCCEPEPPALPTRPSQPHGLTVGKQRVGRGGGGLVGIPTEAL